MKKFHRVAISNFLALVAIPILSLAAQAKTTVNPTNAKKDKVIFACTTTNQKQILVTEKNNRFRYQFGKPNHLELVFEDDKKAAIARSPLWSGVGRSIWSNLVLQNGDYYYTLYTSTDRMTDEHETEEGVTVSKSDRSDYDSSAYINNLKCNPKKPILVNLPEEVMF